LDYQRHSSEKYTVLVSEGEAILRFFSLTYGAFIFTWNDKTLDNSIEEWIVSTYGVTEHAIFLYRVEDVLAKDGTQYIAKRNLLDNSIQIKSDTEYYFLERFFDSTQYFECASFTKEELFGIMLKPRLINCLECEECLSCLTKGWRINKK
jgi:hypothetical protein